MRELCFCGVRTERIETQVRLGAWLRVKLGQGISRDEIVVHLKRYSTGAFLIRRLAQRAQADGDHDPQQERVPHPGDPGDGLLGHAAQNGNDAPRLAPLGRERVETQRRANGFAFVE